MVLPQVRPLDQYNDLLAKLKEEEISQGRINSANTMKLALVELGKIRVRQMRLNLDYVNDLLKNTPPPDDLGATVRFCLPTKDQIQKTSVQLDFDPDTLSITLISDDARIQYLEPTEGQDSFGLGYAGFRYGVNSAVHVINHRGTPILKNGYHRAVALLKANHTFLPCVLTDATNEFKVKNFPRSLVVSEKSPLLSDFNTEAAILVPRRKTRFKVIIRAQVEKEPV
jgi:hypothetical protein